MGSRTRFAVAMGLLQCVAVCLGLPASAQAPDKADAAAARKEGTLSWYTSTPVALAQQLASKFQQETGIKVQLLRTGGQAVLSRLQQEISAGRPGADVITMSDAGAANGLAKRACLRRSGPRVSTRCWMKDRDGRWIAQRLSMIGIPIRSDKVTDGRAETWSDLKHAEIQGPHGDARSVLHRDPAGRGRHAVAQARLGLLQGAARERHHDRAGPPAGVLDDAERRARHRRRGRRSAQLRQGPERFQPEDGLSDRRCVLRRPHPTAIIKEQRTPMRQNCSRNS